jgi:nucleoid-associated protein YgaU
MTALWVEPAPPILPSDPEDGQQALRLVEADHLPHIGRSGGCQGPEPWSADAAAPDRQSGRAQQRRRTSLEVRRRRTLLAILALLLTALALPLSGTGGSSHTTGSAPVETGGTGFYTVRSGDTLWSIAERVDPTSDPRPLVAELAKEIGSDAVVPGERIAVP